MARYRSNFICIDCDSEFVISSEMTICPNCNGKDIECEGGEFNEWYCNNCDQHFDVPKIINP